MSVAGLGSETEWVGLRYRNPRLEEVYFASKKRNYPLLGASLSAVLLFLYIVVPLVESLAPVVTKSSGSPASRHRSSSAPDSSTLLSSVTTPEPTPISWIVILLLASHFVACSYEYWCRVSIPSPFPVSYMSGLFIHSLASVCCSMRGCVFVSADSTPSCFSDVCSTLATLCFFLFCHLGGYVSFHIAPLLVFTAIYLEWFVLGSCSEQSSLLIFAGALLSLFTLTVREHFDRTTWLTASNVEAWKKFHLVQAQSWTTPDV